MESARHGQRLLMALTAGDAAEGLPEFTSALVVVGGLLCLVLVALMCVCGERKPKSNDQELSPEAVTSDNKVEVPMDREALDVRLKPSGEDGIANGDQAIVSTPPGHTDHKRQASTSSGPAGMRPTSLRELPEPPVSARHSRNTSMSGVELPPVPDTMPAVSERGLNHEAESNNMYAYPKHVSPRVARPGVKPSGQEVDKVKSHSDGYDHLGQKPQSKPTDYDSLSQGSVGGERSPMSEAARGAGDHYSLVRERTYDVVKDVKDKAKKIFDPYSTVADKDANESEVYRPSKEEDPYNHIGDSDGGVPSSLIRHLRESSDVTDPYSTVQDASGGDLKSILRSTGGGGLSPSTKGAKLGSPASPGDPHNDYEDTEEEEEEEAEYAVVHKVRGSSERRNPVDNDSSLGGRGSHTNSDDFSQGAALPPEPPRLFNAYEDEEGPYSVTSPSGEKKEHKYSKVTARESLASMSARNALNPYETVQDLPENTYATVEGGSGDGVVLRHVDSVDNTSNRNSQDSDTYAEIAISGGCLSNSVISNHSSVGGNNGSNSNTNGTGNSGGGVTMMNNSFSSGAPAPPSLDSLHLMTKSQTSSEGDRLSDRHLASPEDSLDLSAAGFSVLPAWGDRTFADADEDSGGSLAEDGYSTLKRVDTGSSRDVLQESVTPSSGRHSKRVVGTPDVLDEETQLLPGYTTVKDCLSEEDLTAEVDDPNYESVDEARAKLRLLYKTERLVGEDDQGEGGRNFSGSSVDGPARKNITVVKVLHSTKTLTVSSTSVTHTSSSNAHPTFPSHSSNSPDKEEEVRKDKPGNKKSRRSRNHDYEELDLSPPTSPSSPPVPSSSVRPSPSDAVSSSSSSPGATSPAASLAEAKHRLAQSHMYEEVSEVRAQPSRSSHGGEGTLQAQTSVSPSSQHTSPTSPLTPSQQLKHPNLSADAKNGAGKDKSVTSGPVGNNFTAQKKVVEAGEGGTKKAIPKSKPGPATWRKSRREETEPASPGTKGSNHQTHPTAGSSSPYTGTRV